MAGLKLSQFKLDELNQFKIGSFQVIEYKSKGPPLGLYFIGWDQPILNGLSASQLNWDKFNLANDADSESISPENQSDC